MSPKIDLSNARDMNCGSCNYPYFVQAVMVKRISKIVTGTPNDVVIPVDVLLCGNCGKPMEELLPKEFRKQPQDTSKAETSPPDLKIS